MIDKNVIEHLEALMEGDVLLDNDIQCLRELLRAVTMGNSDPLPLLRVRCGRKEAFLDANSVKVISSTSGSSTLRTISGEQWCTSQSMKSIENIWGELFLRLDRNTSVNRNFIESVQSSSDGTFSISTIDGETMQVSRRCFSGIRKANLK